MRTGSRSASSSACARSSTSRSRTSSSMPSTTSSSSVRVSSSPKANQHRAGCGRTARRATICRTTRRRPDAMATNTLTITDNRTGRSSEVPVADGTIRAIDLRQIKVDDEDFGLMSYDPAFLNTASTRSSITYIDGDRGILRYRGYPIEQLAAESPDLENAYLLLFRELP